MSIGINSFEHAIATVAHDIVVGAKATESFLAKAETTVAKDAPTVEALTALVDPRAATIERIGAALLGVVIPQVTTVAGDVATEASTPSVTLTAELVAEIKSLAASLSSEITAAKATVTPAPTVAGK